MAVAQETYWLVGRENVRITPAQLAMSMFLGERLPEDEDAPEIPLAHVIRRGHEELVLSLDRDIGFDPLRWHEALTASESDLLGYRWSNGHRSFPRRIREAMMNAEWRATVAELEAPRAPVKRPAD